MPDAHTLAVIGGCLALSAIGFAAAARMLLRADRDAPGPNIRCLECDRRVDARARVCQFCGANIV